ncbi:MAG: sugar ABC transporter permease [Clostridiales bacterium]|nr:sugar ABC transporter permease [Clostridiales bacterium]
MHAKLPKKSASAVQRDGVKLFFMLLPCLIFVFLFSYLPLWGWSYSFFNYKPGKALLDCEFVGWDHFTRLFGNPVLRRQLIMVLRNTLAMAGLGVLFSPLTPVFAICMSELTNRRYRKIVQTLTTLPHFISWTIMYSLVFFMLNVNTGFINNLLVQTGVLDQPVNFLVSQDHVWLTMQGYGLWKGLGWGAIVYMAAIAGIDQELYEAAMIDGAGRLQRIWYITVPGLVETYFVLLIISFGNFLNTGMEQYYVFQNAMNQDYIQVLDLYVYNQGIKGGQVSYATAIGTMKSLIALVLFTFANILSKKVRGTSVF